VQNGSLDFEFKGLRCIRKDLDACFAQHSRGRITVCWWLAFTNVCRYVFVLFCRIFQGELVFLDFPFDWPVSERNR
jgi:hypothetical protein